MRLKNFLFLLVKSLNPLNYKMLITQKKRDVVKYFLFLLFFAIIIGGIFSIPRLVHFPEQIEKTVAKFETFNITGVDVELKEPIVLLKRPRIVLDLSPNRTQLQEETILVTKTHIMWKRFSPSLWEFRLFTTEKKPVEEYSDILQDVNRIKSSYIIFFIMILPSLFFIVYLLNFVKFSLLIILFTLLGFIFMKIRKKKSPLFRIMRAATFAMTLFVILDVSILPLFNFGILPLLIYIVIYISGLSFMTDKEIDIKND